MTYYPEGHLLKTKENLAAMHSWNTLAESMNNNVFWKPGYNCVTVHTI